MAQQNVRFEQFFAAPPEPVFAWFAQHENIGRMFPGRCKRIKDATQGDDVNGVGSVRETRFLMHHIQETITTFEPPSCIEYRLTKSWAIKNCMGRMQLKAVPGGTQLEYSIEFDFALPGAGALLAGTMCHAWRRGVQKAVEEISTAS